MATARRNLLSVIILSLALAAAAPAATQPAAPTSSEVAMVDAQGAPVTNKESLGAKPGSSMTPFVMFQDAELVVKIVMVGLAVTSLLSWTILILKMFEFSALNRRSSRFLEAFRTARSLPEMGRIAMTGAFEGDPLADMAAAAVQEVELTRQAGLDVGGDERAETTNRAREAVGAVQSQLAKRLSSGMQVLASTGSNAPFVGLFGTVYGIMYSFIGIAESNTTTLSVVAPGIAQALLATGIGLFAAIPAVVFYNIFQGSILAYGTRTEGFVAELMNAVSRQLGKGG